MLEWGQGTCSLTKHTRRWTYSECCLVRLAAFFDLVKLLFELGLASIPCAVGGIILLANYLLLQQRGWLYIHFNHLYQRWSSSYSANLQQRWHCPKQDGLSAGNSNSLKFVILEKLQCLYGSLCWWHCPKQDGLSPGNSNSLEFKIF